MGLVLLQMPANRKCMRTAKVVAEKRRKAIDWAENLHFKFVVWEPVDIFVVV